MHRLYVFPGRSLFYFKSSKGTRSTWKHCPSQLSNLNPFFFFLLALQNTCDCVWLLFYKIICKVILNSWKYFAFSSKNIAPDRDQAQTFSAEKINIWKKSPTFCRGVSEPHSLSAWWHLVTQNGLVLKEKQRSWWAITQWASLMPPLLVFCWLLG